MVSISPISALNCSQPTIKTKKHNNLQPLKSDTVSFGNAQKLTGVGTDAILYFVNKSAELLSAGKKELVTDVASLFQAGKIQEAISKLSEVAPPNGAIRQMPNETIIISRNWEGPCEHSFKHVNGFKNLGLIKKLDDAGAAEVFNKAFGVQPKTTIGMVGWTNIKPATVKGSTTLSKAELTKAYEEAIEEFYTPVDNYFIKGLGVNPQDRALVSSVSYSGVDKALMDLGEQKGINTLTVTPFDYASYGRNEHPFPTIITDTIPQYVDVYGKLSNNIVVTGGRDHAFKFDAGGKWLKQNNGLVIPVDVLKDFKGITVPATIDGKIENAAAAAYETFSDPLPRGVIADFRQLPWNPYKQELQHPAQKALASAIARDLGMIK